MDDMMRPDRWKSFTHYVIKEINQNSETPLEELCFVAVLIFADLLLLIAWMASVTSLLVKRLQEEGEKPHEYQLGREYNKVWRCEKT